MRITWIKPEDLIEHELNQATEEGKDVDSLRAQWEKAKANNDSLGVLRQAAGELFQAVQELPGDPKLQVHEPSSFEEILELAPVGNKGQLSGKMPEEELFDRILGAWLGRAAGCLLGKPVEKIPREGIAAILKASGDWPLRDYFTAEGVPDGVLAAYPWNRKSAPNSLRENIVCMPEDDDMNFPMLNLHILETYGDNFDTDDVGDAWLKNLPVLTVFTAERVAYMNCLHLIVPPETATHKNPYREWIGAQIRADLWGWVNPGNPERAANMAFRDASLSHVRNGIYGEMFMAAMIAGAFVTDNIDTLVDTGLSYVPAESRLAKAVETARRAAREVDSWEEVLDRLYEEYGRYHWVHTINNAALVTASLVYGAKDYEKTICAAVMGGWDTDCNGATVGSILGIMLGAKGLPDKWIHPLDGRVRSSLKGFDNITFIELAQRTCKKAVN